MQKGSRAPLIFSALRFLFNSMGAYRFDCDPLRVLELLPLAAYVVRTYRENAIVQPLLKQAQTHNTYANKL